MRPGRIYFILFVIFVVILGINLYQISTKTDLTDFSELPTNDNKNIQVRAFIAHDMPVDIRSGETSTFSVRDLKGKLYAVKLDKDVLPEFNTSKIAVLLGHLHTDHFHAVDILSVEN